MVVVYVIVLGSGVGSFVEDLGVFDVFKFDYIYGGVINVWFGVVIGVIDS